MLSFLLRPIDQARIYNVVSTRAYTVGQETKFLGTTLRGAPIFTTVTNDNKCAVANFRKENMSKMSHGHNLNTKSMSARSMRLLWDNTVKYRLTCGMKDENMPLIGEKARGIGSADNSYHLQEAQ